MPSFNNRHCTPDRLRSKNDLMDEITESTTPGHRLRASGRKDTTASSPLSHSVSLGPSDGSLLDYFDLPSPPSTPQRSTHSLSYSSLNTYPSPANSPGLALRSRRSSSSTSSSTTSTPLSSPLTSPPLSTTTSSPTPPLRWPTASQRIARLPTRTRPRSSSSCSSSSSSSSTSASCYSTATTPANADDDDDDVVMSGTAPPLIRPARRTPYYPPNSSRNVDRARVYMNRGPHYIPNWTPLSSLPRHVQLRIEERMVRFTAL